jgi:hypothetical protein
VKIEEAGDSECLIDKVVDKFRFILSNDPLEKVDRKPASGRPLRLVITKASLSTERKRATLELCKTLDLAAMA